MVRYFTESGPPDGGLYTKAGTIYSKLSRAARNLLKRCCVAS